MISSARPHTVREGELICNEEGVFCVDDAEHRHPELLFRVGVALSILVVDEMPHQLCHNDCEKINAMLTSDKRVEEVVTKAQLLADGGTNLHVLAYSGDTTALSRTGPAQHICTSQRQRVAPCIVLG